MYFKTGRASPAQRQLWHDFIKIDKQFVRINIPDYINDKPIKRQSSIIVKTRRKKILFFDLGYFVADIKLHMNHIPGKFQPICIRPDYLHKLVNLLSK